MKHTFHLVLAFILILWMPACQEQPADAKKQETDIYFLRIEGRAYLNEDRLDEAREAYQNLLKLVPEDASAHANLGLIYLKQSDFENAGVSIRKALKYAPEDPEIRMISASYFEMTQQPDKAIGELEKIVEGQPDHLIALYSLAKLHARPGMQDASGDRQKYLNSIIEASPGSIVPRMDLVSVLLSKGDFEGAARHLEELPRIFPEFPSEVRTYYDQAMTALHTRDTAAIDNLFLRMHNFLKVTTQYQADLRDLSGPEGILPGISIVSLGDLDLSYAQQNESAYQRIRFIDVTANTNLQPENEGTAPGHDAETKCVFALGDYDNDGFVDVYFSSTSAGHSVRYLMRNYFGTHFLDQTEQSGFQHTGQETAARFGDYDNDGFIDLFIVGNERHVLYRNTGDGAFRDVSEEAQIPDEGRGTAALFFDADQDGDLDLLVTRRSTNLLYRNNGDGTFSEMAGPMGFGMPLENCREAGFADFDEDGDLDLVLARAGAPGCMLSNERHGKYQDKSVQSGLAGSHPAAAVEAGDYNNDGFADVFLLSASPGKSALYVNQRDGMLAPVRTPWLDAIRDLAPEDAMFLDFDNDGFLDLLITGRPTGSGGSGIYLFHNNTDGSFSDVSELLPTRALAGQQVSAVDFDKDGDLDLFIADVQGNLRLLQNEGGNLNHHLKLQLVGLRNGNGKNNHFGIGAKVELRASALYQMKYVTEPVIHFGLGSRLKADVIRVIWPNGVAQDKYFPGTDQELIESQVLKGSCAFLYTWDGEQYVFSKDMMWRSALGMPLGIMGGNMAYAPADPSQEYLKIPGEKMVPQDGKYILQITEELWETAYFDNVEIVVADHPDSEDIFVDERFTLPPYSNTFSLYAVQKKILPVAATDGYGTDVLEAIREKDDRYLSNFRTGDYQGIAELHDLILDPGSDLPSGDVLLYMQGWLFPSDASINVAVSQSSDQQVIPPQLQVVGQNGAWVTVNPSIGFPMGKDKTMIVDLSGKFLSDDHRVRIRTNMEIYWDAIFFAGKAAPQEIRTSRLKPSNADLHYRGFSQLYRKGGRHGPHWFDYTKVETGQKWRDLIGSYTRYGDVTPLLAKVDDQLVIMNSGDEMTVSFDASELPALPDGWKRDFLIYSEGWIKDGDLNTAHGKTVEPLPFHGMTRYPYGPGEKYPADPDHVRYLKKYNTREVGTRDFVRAIADMDSKPGTE